MEVVLAIAGKVGEYTVAPIGRQLGYLFCYRSNLNELRKKAKMLEEAKESVQHLVDAARNNGEEIERGVLNWLGRVDETSLQVKNFQGDARHARAGSPKWIDTASTPAGYMAFESRAKILNEIMEALKNPDINMIGVYGLGGVGKTTLVKDVARKAQEDKLFDAVAMSVVAQKVEVNKIQKEIAEMLGMKLDEESEIVRASRLHDRLKQEKNVLMILDDLWVGVDLSKIGIPFGIKHKGCKLLLTSRDQEVLTNKIDVKKPFFLGVLPEEEAWELFKQMAGLENLKENSEFMSTTTEVAKKCAGLPIAIVTVGRALRNKSLSEWRDALLQMKRPTSRNSNRMQEVVDSSIKLSFDNLESEELKNIFLLCTMQMDYDIFFTDLLKYSVGLGLFTGIYTIKEARDRLNTLISKLKATCLLLDSYSSDFFTMHDVVRDAAISIASNLQHAFVVRYEKGNEWPEKEQLRICTAISLIKSDIGGLPEGMDCPSLKFFHLDNKESNSFPTPDSFFQGMRGLKVELPKIETLKLSSINSHKIWQDQPSAASYWVQNLTSFIVEDCRNLKHLFSYSVAETLVKLKHLEICYFHMIEEIILTEGRISNSTLPHSHEALFPNLEALVISYMDNLKTIWSVDHVSPNSFGKLKSLNINYCKKLLSIVPSYMLRKLQNLETIKVGNCGSLNEIVRIDGGDEDHGEVHTRLKILSLDG
ncbi:Disease resistance protein [Quillaja saponaria]|uniref:Disease resistance protein n=1 Tax=Quillaja saponaria TaxID=32244 RepID=A0AAD7KNX9_QUISA|nr:Disease resistance protein [Quillaja saponaria]